MVGETGISKWRNAVVAARGRAAPRLLRTANGVTIPSAFSGWHVAIGSLPVVRFAAFRDKRVNEFRKCYRGYESLWEFSTIAMLPLNTTGEGPGVSAQGIAPVVFAVI